jgi:uncharacterized protein YukE
MAIELPSEVVDFLQFIGIDWPNVNEDSVRDLAGHVRDFASNIDSTHQAASQTVQAMSSSYQGASYEQLVQTWAAMSSSHMQELVDGCHVVATALDVAADAIVAAKGVAIAELIALAASFVADQAAAVLTFGIAEAAEALVITAAKECVKFLEQQLEQMIIGQVLEAAMTPLEGVIERAVSGLVYKGLEAATAGAGGSGAGPSFMMDRSGLLTHAQTFQDHADQVVQHAQTFQSNLASVSFE